MLYFVYNFLVGVALLIALPFLPLLGWFGGRFGAGLGQRLGLTATPDIGAVFGMRPIWIHAASVGEVRSAARFASELRRRRPGAKIVLSTFTATGYRMGQELNAADAVMFLPLDFSWIVGRVLNRIEPAALIVIETEIWPNLLREAFTRGIPTVLLSGRLSSRALGRYRRLGGLFRRAVKYFSALGMQSEEDAARMRELGAHAAKISVTGSLKRALAGARTAAPSASGGRGHPVLVVGSSHAGEEALLLEVFTSLRQRFPKLQLVLAPRHPQRFAEVEKLLADSGLSFEKKSAVNGRVHFDKDIMFVDTLGDLQDFYAAGDIAFVGGSLVDRGGHNLLEPAAFRKPVLFGPYTANFASLAAEIKRAGAGIEVRGREDLIDAVGALLDDPERRRAMGEKAYAIAADDRGVLERSMDLLARYL